LNYLAIPGASGFCATDDGLVLPAITWTLTAGTWNVLRSYDTDGGNIVTSYPLNPARPSTHAEYNDQDFWEAAYSEAVANGDMAAGLVYGVDYPESQAYGYVGTLGGTVADPDPIPLSDIVGDICDGCGLTDRDVSDLESVLVHGYALTTPTTGKAGIDPLRPFGYFDAVESEFTYKFVRRGHDSVMTIDAEDLSARLGTEDRPPAMTVVRAQDQELPRLVRAHYIDLERDGDPGQSEQQRQTVDSVNMTDLQVPVVMSSARGQAMVDTVLFERWIGRNTYQCALPFKYVPVEPTDCIDVVVDGTTERLRVTSQNLRGLAVLELSAVRDDASVYSGTDIVGTNTGGGTIPEGGVPSPTELVLLELPALRAQDVDCGYYAAARGLLSGWPGAIIYRATSAAGTFRQVAWTSIAATMGYVTDRVDIVSDTGDTETGTSPITGGIDLSTVLRVSLYNGTFESVSEDDLISGENLIAVGTEGDWELIRFQLAVLGTDGVWELSNLLREQLGTARREILEDDIVVLMTGPGIMRIDESESAEGVSRVIRAVTSGTSLEDAENHTITTECLSLAAEDGGVGDVITSVISRSLSAAPTSPSCDDAYIVAATPVDGDAWFNHVDEIARYDCTLLAWEFTDPVLGRQIYVEDEAVHVYWNGSAFVEAGGFDYTGTPAHGDILYHGASGWELLPASTSGYRLKTNGPGAAPEWVSPSVGTGVWALADEAEVTGAAATNITISGLDLDTDVVYMVAFDLDNGSGSTININFFANGDTTGANYYVQSTTVNNATVTNARSNTANPTSILTTDTCSGEMWIRRNFDGIVMGRYVCNRASGVSMIDVRGTWAWQTANNLTSLTINSSVASAFSIGSKVRIYRAG
jgi:hypothetical protein